LLFPGSRYNLDTIAVAYLSRIWQTSHVERFALPRQGKQKVCPILRQGLTPIKDLLETGGCQAITEQNSPSEVSVSNDQLLLDAA
jgi:hypothetical protein